MNMRQWFIKNGAGFYAVCFLILGFSAVPLQAQIKVWAEPDLLKVKLNAEPKDKSIVWDGKNHTVHIYGASNETVAFQLVFTYMSDGTSVGTVVPVTLTASDGSASAIPLSDMDLFHEHYMTVSVPTNYGNGRFPEGADTGDFPEQMVPFGALKEGAPFTLTSGRNEVVWCDITIPEDAKAGDYTGTWLVGSPGAGTPIKVIVTVWDITLPQETHFKEWVYYGPEQIHWAFNLDPKNDSDKLTKLETDAMKVAHKHRFVLCPLIGTSAGSTEKFYRNYWAKYGPYMNGAGYTEGPGKGVGANVWIAQIDEETKDKYEAAAKILVTNWDQWKTNNKLNIDDLELYVADEPHSASEYQSKCEWSHEAVGKKLLTMVTTTYRKDLKDDVDVWVSNGNTPENAAPIHKNGGEIWTYNYGWGGGPYVDTPGPACASQALMGWKYGFDGWLFWDSMYWVDKQGKKLKFKDLDSGAPNYPFYAQNATKTWEEPMTFDETRKKGYSERSAMRMNGDGVLFYPGKEMGVDALVTGFRMKSLREGQQMYEYLWLLDQKGKHDDAMSIVNKLVQGKKQWNMDAEAWEQARRDLAQLLAATAPSVSGQPDSQQPTSQPTQ